MQRLFACSLMLLVLFAGGARADEWREIPYKDLARMQVMLEKVDTGHVFSSKYVIEPAQPGKQLPANLRVEVRLAERAIPVAIDPDGRLHLPARQDWIDSGAMLRLNQPKGLLKVTYSYRVRTPPGTRMRYSQLTESVQVMVRGIDEAAGLLRFLAPKPYALGLTFPPGTAQEVVLGFADGSSKRFRAVPKGSGQSARNELELPWNPDWRDAEVTLGAPLRAVLPLMK